MDVQPLRIPGTRAEVRESLGGTHAHAALGERVGELAHVGVGLLRRRPEEHAERVRRHGGAADTPAPRETHAHGKREWLPGIDAQRGQRVVDAALDAADGVRSITLEPTDRDDPGVMREG
jgi:hypothetical protein